MLTYTALVSTRNCTCNFFSLSISKFDSVNNKHNTIKLHIILYCTFQNLNFEYFNKFVHKKSVIQIFTTLMSRKKIILNKFLKRDVCDVLS